MIRSGLSLFLLCGIFLGAPPCWADKSIPPPPTYYVLDEPRVLNASALQAIQTLLVEHDHATGEQVVIGIFQDLENEDLVDFTNRVFKEWKIGQRGKDNGVLLSLYWKNRKARIEVGYGLEPLLTDAKSKRVLTQILIPELKAGHPERALSLAVIEILQILESPLIQSGKAQAILKAGGYRGSFVPSQKPALNGWVIWLVLGVILLSIALNLITSADAHFTRSGWSRESPWRGKGRGLGAGFLTGLGMGSLGRSGRIFHGGGGFGGGGGLGGGGFSGGGGLSGGGGASGSW